MWVATTSIRGQNRLVFGVSILPVMGFANHVPRQSYIYQCMSGYRRYLLLCQQRERWILSGEFWNALEEAWGKCYYSTELQ